MKVSKRWQNFHLWVSYLFNILQNACTQHTSCFELELTSKYISALLSFYEWLTYRKPPQLLLKWKVLRAESVCVIELPSMLTSDSPAVDIRAFPEKSSTSRNIRAATSVASPAGSPGESSRHWSCKTLSPIQSKSLLKQQTVAQWIHEIWYFDWRIYFKHKWCWNCHIVLAQKQWSNLIWVHQTWTGTFILNTAKTPNLHNQLNTKK